MAEKILELQIGDQIIQVPIKPDDTPEALSKVLSDNGFDPSKYTNEINSALSQDESSDIGAELAGFSPEEKAGLKTALATAYEAGDKKEIDRINAVITAMKSFEPKNNKTSLPAKEREDLNALRGILEILPKFAEKKNSGFGGKGIDTGPIVGGQLPIPFMDNPPKIFPAGVSEFLNRSEGENAADRAALRQLEKMLFNPVKKDISGTAVSNQERALDIGPMLPSESDNDIAFFNKTFQSQQNAIEKIKTILDTAKRSNVDVSGFEDLSSLDPNQEVEKLKEMLLQNEKGSFAQEFPQTKASFLLKMLNKNKPQQDQVIDLNQFVK